MDATSRLLPPLPGRTRLEAHEDRVLRERCTPGYLLTVPPALSDPLVTCEPVLTETLFNLKRGGLDPDLVLGLVERGELICDSDLPAEVGGIRRLLRKYRDLPATLADICLVRMSEAGKDCAVFTLNSDFLVYRRNGRQVIPLIAPF